MLQALFFLAQELDAKYYTGEQLRPQTRHHGSNDHSHHHLHHHSPNPSLIYSPFASDLSMQQEPSLLRFQPSSAGSFLGATASTKHQLQTPE
jgi:hypothetical protein